ncbi:MAG: hypothetical protein H6Q00_1901 [Holophagaceae bacterium]|nr:hypothetical protein [Holophagaceae bacterium]
MTKLRLRGWLWILALALLGSFAVLRMRSGHAIETDLLAMLPATERNPVAEDAVQKLAQASGNRAIFLVGGAEPARSKAAALGLIRDLEASGAFPQVQGTLKDLDPGMVPRFYAPHRFGLPASEALPDQPESLLQHLQARLASPQAASFGLGLAQDPLGDLEGFLAKLPLNGGQMQIQDDLLVIQGRDGLYVLCTAALSGSAFDPKVQEGTRLAVVKAEQHLAQAFPEVKLLRTGAVFYAIDARTRAEREMHLISGISMVCIFLLHLLVFRSLRHLLLGLASIGAGLVTAAAVSLIFFDKLYLLTLVCGASVLGDAVDYSFLYFANHLAYAGEGGPPARQARSASPLALPHAVPEPSPGTASALTGEGSAWEPWEALRRIRKPLIHGFLTTMLGYLALMLAPFPGLRVLPTPGLGSLRASGASWPGPSPWPRVGGRPSPLRSWPWSWGASPFGAASTMMSRASSAPRPASWWRRPGSAN